MLKDNGILWLARNENRNLIDSKGTVTGREKLMCPFCSGEVYVLPGFGFIHHNSPCTKDPSALEASQIQIIAEEMLMAGHNLYVKPVSSNGRLLAPDKINTRKGTNFQRNMDINGLAADLTWTSSKGFRMGVSFSSHLLCDAQPSIVERCFVVVVDAAALAERFRSQALCSGETILSWARQSLSEAGGHAIWRFVALPINRTVPELPPVEAYQHETFQYWKLPEHRVNHNPVNAKKAMAKVQQCVEDPVTHEIVCICTVKYNGREHDFQVAQYDGLKILMSNVGESLPKHFPDYDLILNACLKAERLHRVDDQKSN